MTAAALAELRKLLESLRPIIDEHSQESGYGFARPDDPNDFHPDAESCTEAEIAAHKAACEAYGKPDYVPPLGSEWIGEGDTQMHILRAPWGIGSYTFRDPNMTNLVARIDAAVLALPQLLDRIDALETDAAAYRQELQNIANAKLNDWPPETRDQFREWAQSRARHTLAARAGTKP